MDVSNLCEICLRLLTALLNDDGDEGGKDKEEKYALCPCGLWML
jgi:hypothetical protein